MTQKQLDMVNYFDECVFHFRDDFIVEILRKNKKTFILFGHDKIKFSLEEWIKLIRCINLVLSVVSDMESIKIFQKILDHCNLIWNT